MAVMTLPKELTTRYKKQRYRIVGDHSAVKTCLWVGKSLNSVGREHCYKQKFYGVPCHRCLQMTPSLGHCTQSCIFCWRATPENLQVGWDQSSQINKGDAPENIVDGCLTAHRKLIYGFGGNKNVSEKMLKEALNPIHAAISLEGEPTLYNRLGDLINVLKGHGFHTVFIVTNGTSPEIIKELDSEPSQLYVSLCAPDEETYMATCRPMIPRSWDKLNETLELLQSLSCPTVIRQTLIPKLNMNNIEGYAKLVEKANPTYIEPKGAMSVGFARQRFAYGDMASFMDIRSFAAKLSDETGYSIIDEQYQSNIILLSRLKKAINLYD
jgi:tRNA wybutosine-synthesizing protein 1